MRPRHIDAGEAQRGRGAQGRRPGTCSARPSRPRGAPARCSAKLRAMSWNARCSSLSSKSMAAVVLAQSRAAPIRVAASHPARILGRRPMRAISAHGSSKCCSSEMAAMSRPHYAADRRALSDHPAAPQPARPLVAAPGRRAPARRRRPDLAGVRARRRRPARAGRLDAGRRAALDRPAAAGAGRGGRRSASRRWRCSRSRPRRSRPPTAARRPTRTT